MGTPMTTDYASLNEGGHMTKLYFRREELGFQDAVQPREECRFAND